MKNQNTHKIWTIKDVLLWTTRYFETKNIQSPQLNAEMIIAKVLNCSRMELYLKFDKPLNPIEREKIRKLLKKRATHYPLQYLLGESEFYGYKFLVNAGVMIPRPETEILVDSVISYIKQTNKNNWNILDIGTGTGIIPISISKYFISKEIKIHFLAIDISETALENAKKNSELHKTQNIKIKKSNLFENISGKFDIIISNPPYISENELNNLQDEVKYFEPKSALLGGKKGLKYYHKILQEAEKYLNEDGRLFFEISATQKNNLEKDIKAFNFKIIDIIKDYNDFYRVLALGMK
ncbi:MAG: peptide chain release factor N(5)-glutamine methyltransferase [Candidatus Cloacimonetes bacterium]|nr:peptide chain release factor N(5)-glutamine methyltransferase [Candidatus Cloacimonadota bacterium]MBL7086167.1 peptide chain release factor N(5)-glutamine methyltransferase [Candidatus Cloacimonadota bacterium]